MPQISLTDFVDIASRTGVSKAKKVREVKLRPSYEPAFDFYKPLRERIIDIHKTGQGKNVLDIVLDSLKDDRKIANYPPLIAGYKKWWGNKKFEWFSPPRSNYSYQGVDIILNPELGLIINGQRHIVKLYFKNEGISKLRVDVTLGLLKSQLASKAVAGDEFTILDIRNSKLISTSTDVPLSIVNAEISYIATLWDQVD